MKAQLFFVAIALYATSSLAATEKACHIVECNPGDKAVTVIPNKNEYYFACPTMDLAEYVTTTIGLVELTYSMTGKLPNISQETGEPEFQGQTKQMIDVLRTKAKVSTYDEAIAHCQKGKSKLPVTILNNPEGTMSIWVSGTDKKPFWMPKSFLDKK